MVAPSPLQPLAAPPEEAAVELKGSVTSLTIVRLKTVDGQRLTAELAERVIPHPQMFLHAPVVVDASGLEGQSVPWAELARILRHAKLVPVAAANLAGEEAERAAEAGFGVFRLGARPLRTIEPEPLPVDLKLDDDLDIPIIEEAPISSLPVSGEMRDPLMVSQAVRGGQVVYARGGDLVARAPVNAGAQVIADGNIHVWAPLRGRALAGAKGKKDARIFCLSLEAELVSVAGEYLMADEIPDSLRQRPVQVFLDGERVRIAPL